MCWGFTSRPHIEDLVMSLFFSLGSNVHDYGWPKNGPFLIKLAKHGRLDNIPKWSKRDQMVNRSVFDHLGPF